VRERFGVGLRLDIRVWGFHIGHSLLSLFGSMIYRLMGADIRLRGFDTGGSTLHPTLKVGVFPAMSRYQH
jgi:hypothetical protein